MDLLNQHLGEDRIIRLAYIPVLRTSGQRTENNRLATQHGKRLRFHDDLVKDKVVMIYLMFTTCADVCPLNTVQLAKLHDYLQRWMGHEITLSSITTEPRPLAFNISFS